ncbi:ABC transporter ATP-binding protein [Nocardioides hungaricus]
MTETTSAGVRVSDVGVRYGKIEALAGVGFDLGEGISGLLGPNGAGKSTLLRVLATAQAPSSGTVGAFGLDLCKPGDHRAARRRIGYLPQSPGLYPSFRVEDFVDHFALLKEITGRQERAREVGRALDIVGLEARASSRIRELSGGMRQRVALACAILGDPALLILDEPTVGLDPEQRARFRETIAGLGTNRIVILSTHQTDDIAALCHRVLVLRDGTVRFDDTPRMLTERARGRVWLSDSRDENALAAWTTSDGMVRNVGAPPAGAQLDSPTLDDGYLVVAGDLGRER